MSHESFNINNYQLLLKSTNLNTSPRRITSSLFLPSLRNNVISSKLSSKNDQNRETNNIPYEYQNRI